MPQYQSSEKIKPAFQQLLVFAAASLTITLFALTPSTTRIAVAQVDGLTIGLLRTVGAGLAAVPFLLLFRLRPPKGGRDWGLLLLSSMGSFAAFPVLFSLGQQITSASHASLIMAVMPLFMGIGGMVIDRRLPRATWFVGSGMAIVGETFLVAIRGQSLSTESTIAGDLIVLASCILFAVGVVAGARLSTRLNPWASTFWALTLAGLCLAPLALLRGETPGWATLAPKTWIALGHVTFGATILANVAWLWALSRGGIVRIAPLQFSQPVLAVIFAYLILQEHLSPFLMLVGTVIIGGIVMAYQGARPRIDDSEAAANRPLSLNATLRVLSSKIGGVVGGSTLQTGESP